MKRLLSNTSLPLVGLVLLIPAIALAWGTLEDVSYKVKGTDGNRWAHLLGGGDVVHGNEQKGKITFTFDDGPDHRSTPVLLDALDRYDVKATFFINGHRIHSRTAGGDENRAVLREMHRRGHHIGNHTFSHEDITDLDDDQWRREVIQVEQLIRGVIGRRPWLFRPPFGRGDATSFKRLSEQRYTIVMWNLDPLDWKAATPQQLLNRTKKVIKENPEGGVFLLHDTNRNTARSFPLIMEWLEEYNLSRAAMGKTGLEVVGIDHFVQH